MGQPGVILGLSWEELEATWVHLGISWENSVTTWVQGHVLEIPKSFSLGPCAAKTLAWHHASAHRTTPDTENVDFTAFLNIGLDIIYFLKLELLILHTFYKGF